MSAKKIISSVLSILLIANQLSFSFAASIESDLSLKISSAGDETYTTNLSNISNNNTDLTFQFVEASSGWYEEYSINLPNGFSYRSSSSTSETTCGNFSVLNHSNGNFRFSFNGTSDCFVKADFTYQVTTFTSAGNHTLSLLSKNGTNWTDVATVNVGVTSSNAITNARTIDSNSDGYIDGYLLSFASPVSDPTVLMGITVAGVSRTNITSSGTAWIYGFTDDLWATGDLPQIGGTFDGNPLSNSSVNETDAANPQIMRINNTLLSTLGVGQSIVIGTGNINIDFSEKMTPTSASAFSLKLGSTPVSGTFTFNANLDRLTFTPSSPLVAGTYTLSSSNAATDWSSNGNALSQTFTSLTVSDTTAPVGSALGAGMGILINSDNLATNNANVQLRFLASDDVGVSEMMISNDSNFAWANWQNYVTSVSNWLLSAGTGTKTVYVKFRDFAGNVSSTYSDSIIYDSLLSYLNFDAVSSIYTNATSITLSGGCNYISPTGIILGTTLDAYVNSVNIGSVSCVSNRWSANFTGLAQNSANTLRVEYTANPSLASSIIVTHPIPSCPTVANATTSGSYPSCSFTCNAGYTKVGGSCVPNNCAAGSRSTNGHSYTTTYLSNGSSNVFSSAPVAIANGTVTYSQEFACSLGTVSTVGNETTNTPSCNTGYSAIGGACVANSCSASAQSSNGHTYTVSSLSHGTSGIFSSAPVAIANGTVTYSQEFACSLGTVSTTGTETINTPSCNSGYAAVGGVCVANGCSTSTQTVHGHTYTVPAFTNGTSTGSTSIVAISNGTITYSQTFSCSLGTVSATGNETSSTPSCNSGYSVSGNACTRNSSGGGGGGWGGGGFSTPVDYCPTGDKSGNIYDGKCNAPTISTWTTNADTSNPWSTSELPISIGTLDNKYFNGYSDVRTYLANNIQDQRVIKLSDTYKEKLAIPDESYFLSVDSTLSREYNRIMNAFALLFLRVNDALLGNRSDSVKSDGKASYSIVASGLKLPSTFLDRYIEQVARPDENITTVYRTKVVGIQKPLLSLENKILSKLSLLRQSGTIDEDEFTRGVQAYNDFVLGLTMYRMFDKNTLAKEKAMQAIKIFSATYAKKVSEKPITPANTTAPAKGQKVGDIYNFSKNLAQGDSNEDVRNLQKVLQSYGYFWTLSPTGFFGTSTKTFLIKFSKEILKIDNPNGLFDAKIRTAIMKIDMK